MQIWLHQQLDFLEEKGEKDPDLKANPWSVVGTNGSKIELLLFGRRPDEGAGRSAELRNLNL